jgi:hypothetical protein
MPCSASVTEQRSNLRVLREPAFPLLREDHLPVREHVELPIAARLDLGRVLGLGVQLSRETRGLIVVAISGGAVLDQDVGHGMNATSGSAAPGSLRMYCIFAIIAIIRYWKWMGLAAVSLVALVVMACAARSNVVPTGTVSSAELEDLREEGGLPMYFAGPSFFGLQLTHAESWRNDGGEAFFTYGTCELPEGFDAGGCALPIEIQHFRIQPRQWSQAVGCSRRPSLRGVPTARHDGLVLFTGSIVVRVYARSAREERRVVEQLRGLNTSLERGEPLPPPTPDVRRVASRACGY